MESKPENYFVPEDIAAEVLVRLPVKSLVRFTVVCKSWYFLIRNPRFITRHLNRNLSREEDPCFLNVYHHSGIVLSEDTLTMRAKFELPYDFAETKIIGSCNGLLCLKIIYGTGEGIFLYNPSIQHLKIVESFRGSELNSLPVIHYGFGYHGGNNDPRLVKLQDFPSNKVEVYSLKTDSWHEPQQSPPRELLGHCRSNTGLYFNGATHWWTSIEVDDEPCVLHSILAFDFNEEVFRDITLPSELQVDMDDFVSINEFQGSLALLVSNIFSRNRGYTTSDLWVMGEYGDSESWSKKFCNIPFTDILQPRGFTKNGSVILSNDGFTRRQSLQNSQYEDSEPSPVVKDIFDFTESLLLLDHQNVLQRYQASDNLFYWNLEFVQKG